MRLLYLPLVTTPDKQVISLLSKYHDPPSSSCCKFGLSVMGLTGLVETTYPESPATVLFTNMPRNAKSFYIEDLCLIA